MANNRKYRTAEENDWFDPIPEKKPERPFTIRDRKKLIQVGEDLHILTDSDILFILDPSHTEAQVRARYTTARQR